MKIKKLLFFILLILTFTKPIKPSFLSFIQNTLQNFLTNFIYQKKLEIQKNKFTSQNQIFKKRKNKSKERKISKLVFSLLNNYRAKLNLRKLQWNNKITKIALKHNIYMEKKKKINHDNFKKRLKGEIFANENVAMFGGVIKNNNFVANKFFSLWKNSESHNHNMISKKINEIGISIIVNEKTKEYYGTMIGVKV